MFSARGGFLDLFKYMPPMITGIFNTVSKIRSSIFYYGMSVDSVSVTTAALAPAGSPIALEYASDNSALFVTQFGASPDPGLYAYTLTNWNGSSFPVALYPNRYSTDNGFGNGFGVAVSKTNRYIGVAGSLIAVNAYPWTRNGFGTKYTGPAFQPSSSAASIDFSYNESALAVTAVNGGSGSPANLFVYRWTNTGFGTKYTDISPNVDSTGYECVKFSKDGNAIAVGISTSPYVQIYAWTSASGFGTKYSDPSSAITGGFPWALDFTNKSDAFGILGWSGSSNYNMYAWSSVSGFGTKYNSPANTGPKSIKFSNQDNYVVTPGASNSGNVIYDIYPWSTSLGFGTKMASSTLTSTQASGVTFNNF